MYWANSRKMEKTTLHWVRRGLLRIRFESQYFFAKDDGRLLEIRDKTQSEEGSAQSLIRLENQKFNPTLPFSLFRFQKPKNAVPIEQFAVGILK